MKGFFGSVWELGKILVVAGLIVVPLRMFVFQPFLVRGASMEPNFHNGDYLIVDELSYRFREPARGEVIVFRFPQDPDQRYIKRIIGLPGETVAIRDGQVFIQEDAQDEFISLDEISYLPADTPTLGDVDIQLQEGEYFMLGDNRMFSSDSRRWGILPQDYIIGRTLLRLFPPQAFAKVQAPTY